MFFPIVIVRGILKVDSKMLSRQLSSEEVPFNRPFLTGLEEACISIALESRFLSGDGPYTEKCHAWLEERTGAPKALLTHSCTAALEIAALLLDIRPGDEIIIPSYTFVSTANAFVLRGGIPVFIDIRPDTLNLDETLLEEAITGSTRAIVPVHYAGVSCEMDSIMEIAVENQIAVVEDAAQGVLSTYKGRELGSIGDLGTYSFHETKNIICGEGGALIVNRERYREPAEIVREKGTDRSRFFRGVIDKYTWQEKGSSYLPCELVASFLAAQLQAAEQITDARLKAWNFYYQQLKPLESANVLRLPENPTECRHNAHIFYVILAQEFDRQSVIDYLKSIKISVAFHYIPLHSSPAGRRFGRHIGKMEVTDYVSKKIVRLPMWADITTKIQMRVVEGLISAIEKQKGSVL